MVKSEYLVFCKKLIESNSHILIAGTTGSGKSVLINRIIEAILAHSGQGYAMHLIDPKKVELNVYKNTFACVAYADNEIDTLKVLQDALCQIETRLSEMQKKGIRTYDGGYHYIVIDELADLLLSPTGKQIKTLLQRILQIGRACRYFVISATQIPARKILDAGLMLNFSIRIALRCNDVIESRQILGTDDACRLPKYGKCIIKGLCQQPFVIDVPMMSDEQINQLAWLMQRSSQRALIKRAKELGVYVAT